MKSFVRQLIRTTTSSVTLLSVVLSNVGCSGEEQSGSPAAERTAARPSTPPPSYSSERVKAASLSPQEIGRDIRRTPAEVEALKGEKASMCSLSGVKLPGEPELSTHQYANSVQGSKEVRYAQLIARYVNSAGAAASFQALQKSARSCPSERHVPAKKIRENFTLFAHDDTWQISEGTTTGWTWLRGVEQQTYPASASKFNVLHFIYDYAVRGNVVVTTVYWERTEPKKPSDPIARRATELLTKQLQKFG